MDYNTPKVDAAQALALYRQGNSLRTIARMLGPGISHLAVRRAVRRAARESHGVTVQEFEIMKLQARIARLESDIRAKG